MLDPFALAKLGRYTLAARLVVDGLFTGQHKSPRKGFSVEFAEHKQYTPGVDPRHLDWKLLARTERLYWFSTGAYTTSYSAVEFNGFPPLKAYYI